MKDTSLFRTILDNIRDGVCFIDRSLRISLWNEAAAAITGHLGEDILGKQCENGLLALLDTDGRPFATAQHPLHASLQSGTALAGEVLLHCKNESYVPVQMQVLPVFSSGRVAGVVAIFHQSGPVRTPGQLPKAPVVKGLGRFEGTPIYAELPDKLTGLPGRGAVQNRLLGILSGGGRKNGTFCAVMANLDNFTAYNNTYGSEVGDMALQSVGDSFLNGVGARDIIARWEGDTFVGIFCVQNPDDIATAAELVRKLVAESGVDFPDFFASLSASVGAAPLVPGDTPAQVTAQLAALVAQSKRQGKNRSTIQRGGK